MTYKKFIKYKNIKNSVQPGDRIFVKSYGLQPERTAEKQQKELAICVVIKFLLKLQKFWKIQNKIIQKQLQVSMIKKYLKKDLYIQKKDKIIDDLRLI